MASMMLSFLVAPMVLFYPKASSWFKIPYMSILLILLCRLFVDPFISIVHFKQFHYFIFTWKTNYIMFIVVFGFEVCLKLWSWIIMFIADDWGIFGYTGEGDSDLSVCRCIFTNIKRHTTGEGEGAAQHARPSPSSAERSASPTIVAVCAARLRNRRRRHAPDPLPRARRPVCSTIHTDDNVVSLVMPLSSSPPPLPAAQPPANLCTMTPSYSQRGACMPPPTQGTRRVLSPERDLPVHISDWGEFPGLNGAIGVVSFPMSSLPT
jgi:hypothetical protein